MLIFTNSVSQLGIKHLGYILIYKSELERKRLNLMLLYNVIILMANISPRIIAPYLTSGCASNMARIRVVPDRGTPPMKMSGM